MISSAQASASRTWRCPCSRPWCLRANLLDPREPPAPARAIDLRNPGDDEHPAHEKPGQEQQPALRVFAHDGLSLKLNRCLNSRTARIRVRFLVKRYPRSTLDAEKCRPISKIGPRGKPINRGTNDPAQSLREERPREFRDFLAVAARLDQRLANSSGVLPIGSNPRGVSCLVAKCRVAHHPDKAARRGAPPLPRRSRGIRKCPASCVRA